MSSADLMLWAAVQVPDWVPVVMNLFLCLTCFVLIVLILFQRGKGGGLTGLISGTGGASAFGARIGDKAMKLTIYLAAIWLLLIMFLIKMTQPLSPSETNQTNVGQKQ